jgi:hypothetical protein
MLKLFDNYDTLEPRSYIDFHINFVTRYSGLGPKAVHMFYVNSYIFDNYKNIKKHFRGLIHCLHVPQKYVLVFSAFCNKSRHVLRDWAEHCEIMNARSNYTGPLLIWYTCNAWIFKITHGLKLSTRLYIFYWKFAPCVFQDFVFFLGGGRDKVIHWLWRLNEASVMLPRGLAPSRVVSCTLVGPSKSRLCNK